MLTTLRNALKIKDLRNKMMYTLVMLVIIRLGSQLPVPGVNREYFASWFSEMTGGAFNFVDAFTGGSFMNMSILALNITPYITSSIIMQLLTIAIPALEEMQRDGEDGRKKIASITRYVTVGFALFESTAMAIGFRRQPGMLEDGGILTMISIIAALTAGSAFLMWIGERITENGVGNGISIVLVINIISRIPQDIASLFNQFVFSRPVAAGVVAAVIILAILVGLVVMVIILNDGERRIPVEYAQKLRGRSSVGGHSSNIPLKINTAGVIPIIFASTILQVPMILIQLFNLNPTGVAAQIVRTLNSSNWCNPAEPVYSIGLVIYIVLVVLFAYFYTSITFNPIEVAENIKKSGGFIPGIRPGKPTSDYLNGVLNYIIFIGAVGLTLVGIIPFFFNGIFNASVSFAGTSLIIIVSVVLETMKQIEAQMATVNYKGFLDD